MEAQSILEESGCDGILIVDLQEDFEQGIPEKRRRGDYKYLLERLFRLIDAGYETGTPIIFAGSYGYGDIVDPIAEKIGKKEPDLWKTRNGLFDDPDCAIRAMDLLSELEITDPLVVGLYWIRWSTHRTRKGKRHQTIVWRLIHDMKYSIK